MRSLVKDRYLTLGLALAIVAVLVILAVLQYRWSNQVSEANEAQIGSNLRSLMTDWHFDLFRDFSSIAVSLQVGPDSGARNDWRDYLGRYKEWQQSATHREIVKDVFIWETSAGTDSRLWGLGTARENIQPVKIPEAIKTLLIRLEQNSGSLEAGLQAWRPRAAGSNAGTPVRGLNQLKHGDVMTGWQFDPTIPAVVHPIIHHQLPGDVAAARRDAIDWIVVTFDASFLRNELLPELTHRYFGNEDGLEYRVAVLADDDAKTTIYKSDPQDNALIEPDAQMSIFGAPPDSTEGRVLEGPRSRATQKPGTWRRFPGPPWFPVIDYGQPSSWNLVVQHRRGSLAGIIAGVRRRNLAISFGVLALLAVSMSLVILATHRAQRFARLQMEFVTVISHELRTPLAVISSAAENIADGLVSGKQLAKYSSAIRNQARQLTHLVEQILHFAATQDGRNRYLLRVLEVPRVVGSAVESTRDLLDREGFTLEQTVQSDLPLVRGDLAALSQCLQNLIVNAVKYGGEQRWIGLRAVSTKVANGGAEVRITVEDRGPGIPHGELDQIFEPFYRAQAAREAQVRGTGLGLTLARSIAEDMGGKLTVSTKLGQGSAFTIHLPAVVQTNSEVAGLDAPVGSINS
jgi:two-component system, OmpR family, sensor histidine kinase SenX3